MVDSTVTALGAPLQILSANWRDLGGLQVLQKQSFPQDAWPLWDLIGILTFPNILRLKAVIHERMIGFLAAERKKQDNLLWIAAIGVLPAYQKCGIGIALLEACERNNTAPAIRLCVRISNKPAQNLYHKMGYQTETIWTRYYCDGEDALIMEKRFTR